MLMSNLGIALFGKVICGFWLFLRLGSQGSKDFVVQRIWQRIVDDNFQSLTKDFAEGIQRVLSERYLYMGYGLSMRYSYGHDCRIYTLPSTYFQTQVSFMMKKNSPLIPILNKM